MSILVKSTNDIKVAFNDRYFLVKDALESIHVVSFKTLKELTPYVSAGGDVRYKFAQLVGGYAEHHTQDYLRTLFNHKNHPKVRKPTPFEVSQLVKNETVKTVGIGRVPTPPVHSAPSIEVPIGQFNGGYVIGSVKGDSISFANNPKVHTTAESAEAEANRLASLDAGKEFVVFKATMSAVKASVVTRTF